MPFVLLLITACFLAWRIGGAPERVAAATFASAWIASVLLERPRSGRFFEVWGPIFAIDLVLLTILLALALKANRYWPTVIVAMHILLMIAHLIRALDPSLVREAYGLMTWIWPYLQLIVLIWGTIHFARHEREQGDTRAWSSLPSTRSMLEP